jgi:hypothetical protein
VRRDFHPVHDRGAVLLGSRSMSGIAVMRQAALVLGNPASASTLWRTLDGIGPVELAEIASALAKVRSRVHDLLDLRPGGFPWIRGFGGSADANTASDHIEVSTEAIRQLPTRRRRKVLFHADGAGATKEYLQWITDGGGNKANTWRNPAPPSASGGRRPPATTRGPQPCPTPSTPSREPTGNRHPHRSPHAGART